MPRDSHLILCALLLMGFAACKKHNSTPSGNNGNNGNPGKQPDVYVLGSTGDSVVYWKNDTPVLLAAGNPATTVSSMFVSNGDVYVCGSTFGNTVNSSIPKYWKNGIATILPDTTGAAYSASIYVSGTDVYVGGTIFYPTNSQVPYTTNTAPYPTEGTVAVWWENGVPTSLPTYYYIGYYIGNGSHVYNGYVSGISITGNDVYVSGGSHQYLKSDTATWQFALYWKNGQAVNLDNGLADSNYDGSFNFPTTTGIYVSGNDVYVCGIETTSYPGLTIQAVYWKNGVLTNLTPGSTKAIANQILVNNGDVYIAGYIVNNGNAQAVYWKNGLINYLSNAPGGSIATAMTVVGNDVYIAGSETVGNTGYATWWKNGVATHLGTGGNTTSIAVQ